ncbi:hypothetical protein CSC94_09370 [Zhengella mangrovi]|uniref:Lipoprotein n=1 Tax=Zhengella mangrovi TaxID=1982044 RepID=A0A2G1QP01_9HYPH|nr:hypothetical protein [Zhengella mangrovi]PHP67243.1 hypothetical protein CSC94_09370 [Zhengella mangrovi]
MPTRFIAALVAILGTVSVAACQNAGSPEPQRNAKAGGTAHAFDGKWVTARRDNGDSDNWYADPDATEVSEFDRGSFRQVAPAMTVEGTYAVAPDGLITVTTTYDIGGHAGTDTMYCKAVTENRMHCGQDEQLNWYSVLVPVPSG